MRVDANYNGSILAKLHSLQVHTRFFLMIQMDMVVTLKNVQSPTNLPKSM
jgi:hypothetical protein